MAITRIGPNQSINLASNITGTLPVGNGGIGIASGTTDQFLKFTGTTTLASAADNAGSWVQIGSTVTASDSATVEFENLASTYQMYCIIGSQIRPATNDIDFSINFGTDGSTYAANKTSVYYYMQNNEGDNDSGDGIQSSGSIGLDSAEQQIMRNVSNNGTYGKAGQVRLYISGLGQGSSYASYEVFCNYWSPTNYINGIRVSGVIQGAADCIRFKCNSGNIAAGKFTLYGITQ